MSSGNLAAASFPMRRAESHHRRTVSQPRAAPNMSEHVHAVFSTCAGIVPVYALARDSLRMCSGQHGRKRKTTDGMTWHSLAFRCKEPKHNTALHLHSTLLCAMRCRCTWRVRKRAVQVLVVMAVRMADHLRCKCAGAAIHSGHNRICRECKKNRNNDAANSSASVGTLQHNLRGTCAAHAEHCRSMLRKRRVSPCSQQTSWHEAPP